MLIPPFVLKHVKTTKRCEENKLIFQYWFQWQERTTRSNNSNHYVRIDLLDRTGKVLAIASGRIPKARILGYKPATQLRPRQRIYDTPELIQIEHDAMATQFRYCILKRANQSTEYIVGELDGAIEN